MSSNNRHSEARFDYYEAEEDLEANELEPLAPHNCSDKPASSPFRNDFLSGFLAAGNSLRDHKRHLPPTTPVTPLSSDGVFANIPAKPSSSRSKNVEDEEMGEDEWIFMTPEQRNKLPPPKYSRIKRDRAPKYTTEYTPPTLPYTTAISTARRPKAVKPRINSLPSGSSTLFFTATVTSALLPIVGFSIMYLLSHRSRRWKCHATRLGSRVGLGLSLYHIGAMLFYIPTLLLPMVFAPSPLPLILCLLWTLVVAVPFGWRTMQSASCQYSWIKAQERLLIERIVSANIPVEGGEGEGDDSRYDNRSRNYGGYNYIEGTDIRVRDLAKILAKARDARLARSLRAAGF